MNKNDVNIEWDTKILNVCEEKGDGRPQIILENEHLVKNAIVKVTPTILDAISFIMAHIKNEPVITISLNVPDVLSAKIETFLDLQIMPSDKHNVEIWLKITDDNYDLGLVALKQIKTTRMKEVKKRMEALSNIFKANPTSSFSLMEIQNEKIRGESYENRRTT